MKTLVRAARVPGVIVTSYGLSQLYGCASCGFARWLSHIAAYLVGPSMCCTYCYRSYALRRLPVGVVIRMRRDA